MPDTNTPRRMSVRFIDGPPRKDAYLDENRGCWEARCIRTRAPLGHGRDKEHLISEIEYLGYVVHETEAAALAVANGTGGSIGG